MQQLKNLPTAAKIAIPAVLGVLVLLLMYMTLSGGAGSVEVYSTTDPDMKDAKLWKLSLAKVTPVVKVDGTRTYHIKVAPSDEAAARSALSGSDFNSRIKANSSAKCKAPGSFGTRSAQDDFADCKNEMKVRDALVRDAGVLEAAVTVVTEDSGDLVGSDKQSSVTAQLFLDPQKSSTVDAGAMAAMVANMVPGGSVDRVFLQDANNNTLWNRNKGAATSGSTAAGACASPTDGSTVDITTKEQMVASCDESNIRQQIAAIVGSTDHVNVVEHVSLSPSARSVSVSRITKGWTTNESSNRTKSGNTVATNGQRTIAPGTVHVNSDTMAGFVTRRSIAVTLDSRFSDTQKEKAVRALLATYIDVQRGDPQPSVQSVRFGTPASSSTSAGDSGTAGTGGANGSVPTTTTTSTSTTDTSGVTVTHATHIPGALIGLAAFVVLLLLGAIGILWRRAAREADRRKLMEQEFMREQAAFERFAQQDPDALAKELHELLGAPGPGVPR